MKYFTLLQIIRFTGFHQLCYHILKLLSKEDGDDSRWCFIAPQTFIISYICRTLSEQISVGIYCFHDTGKDQQKLDVFIGRFSRL